MKSQSKYGSSAISICSGQIGNLPLSPDKQVVTQFPRYRLKAPKAAGPDISFTCSEPLYLFPGERLVIIGGIDEAADDCIAGIIRMLSQSKKPLFCLPTYPDVSLYHTSSSEIMGGIASDG